MSDSRSLNESHRMKDVWQRGRWSLTAQITMMSCTLAVAILVGLVWDFRLSGFILAALLIVLAGLRITGRGKVFSARSKKFDAAMMLVAALFLIVFSGIAPA